jgi:hypothetical protein
MGVHGGSQGRYFKNYQRVKGTYDLYLSFIFVETPKRIAILIFQLQEDFRSISEEIELGGRLCFHPSSINKFSTPIDLCH